MYCSTTRFTSLLGICLIMFLSCNEETIPQNQGQPTVSAATPVDAGRYLITVGGCNDCHTDQYLFREGDIPEEDWLLGSPVGFQGPWGTTYAANLRLFVQDLTEDTFVETLHTRSVLPPMPWMNVNQISDQDARAIYQYLHHLGPAGERAPVNVPPGEEPDTPYILLVPQHMDRLEGP